jgi:DNA-directed RNA polymerase specialized sigma24 family protein
MTDPIVSLYRDAFPDCARMIRGMGGTLEEAKDAFHDALLVYLEKERPIKHTPRAYILGTAKICWLQTRKRGTNLLLAEGLDATQPEEPAPEEQEKSLLRSLQASGQKCLELLTAFYYDHLSLQDIAARFGFNGIRSATVQKYKCLEKVREKIKTETYA